MASEQQPSGTSGLGASTQSLISNLSPSSTCQRSIQSTTVRHSLVIDDGRPLDLLKNSIVSKSNLFTRNHPTRTNSKAIRRSASCSAATGKSMHPSTVQRWSGLTRTVGEWDGLRRVCERLRIQNPANYIESRIPSSGMKTETATSTCTEEELHGEVHPSAFPSEFCDRRSATPCSASAMRR